MEVKPPNMPDLADSRKQTTLRRYEQQYERLKAELLDLGYVLQGSVTQRWMQCGKKACRCHDDPTARHGPYWQWSWKVGTRTASVYLDPQQAAICRRWIENDRRMRRIIKKMRSLSLRIARLYKIASK